MRWFILIFFSSMLHGQSVASLLDNTNEKGRFMIGLSGSMEYNYRLLINNDGSEDIDRIIKVRNDSEQALWGYTAGLKVFYKLNERSGLVSGMNYALKGMQTMKQEARFGTPEPDDGFEFHLEYRMHYLEVPLIYEHRFTTGNIAFSGAFGVAPSIFIEERVKTIKEFEKGKKDIDKRTSDYDYKRYNVFAYLGFIVGFPLSEHIQVRVGPTGRMGLFKIIDTPLSARLWSLGVETTAVLSF